MGGRVGSITTEIIADGLVFNMDAANRASYVPNATTTFNTIDLSSSGSLTNGVNFLQPPISSSCWDFDGSDDYIELGQIDSSNPISFAGTTENTWEAWINSKGTGDGYQRIIDKSSAGGGIDGYFLSLGTTAGDGRIWCKIENQTGIDNVAISGYTDNVWQHLVVTRVNNTTNGWKIYLNGVLKDERDSGNDTIPTDTTGCRIGSWNHSTAREFNGQIAAVRLYNRALSSTEVLHNYNALKGRFGL